MWSEIPGDQQVFQKHQVDAVKSCNKHRKIQNYLWLLSRQKMQLLRAAVGIQLHQSFWPD